MFRDGNIDFIWVVSVSGEKPVDEYRVSAAK
jgi:hypothetical protein